MKLKRFTTFNEGMTKSNCFFYDKDGRWFSSCMFNKDNIKRHIDRFGDDITFSVDGYEGKYKTYDEFEKSKVSVFKESIDNSVENQWFVEYGLGGGFSGGIQYEVIEANSEEEANNYAYNKSKEEYETYEGNGGIRSVSNIMEEDDIEDEEEAEMIYNDERESWLHYSAEVYNPEKHKDYLN